jgi:hypothetical protein
MKKDLHWVPGSRLRSDSCVDVLICWTNNNVMVECDRVKIHDHIKMSEEAHRRWASIRPLDRPIASWSLSESCMRFVIDHETWLSTSRLQGKHYYRNSNITRPEQWD